MRLAHLRRLASVFGILGVLLFVGAEPAWSQAVIRGGPECTACSISIVSMDQVGGDEMSDSWIPFFPRDATLIAGNRIAMTFSGGQTPTVYSLDRVESELIGRFGEGPGEYNRPKLIHALPGDSLLIIDLFRASVVDPEGEFVRSVRFEMQVFDALVLEWPGNVVIAADMSAPITEGYSLVSLDFSASPARLVNSFAENRPYFVSRANEYERTVTRAPGGGLIAAKRLAYEIEQYHADGSLAGEWERVADWAPRNPETILGGPRHAPTWQLAAIHMDDEGRLWVYSQVGRADWRTAWESRGIDDLTDGEVRSSELPSALELMTTRVEVIDLARGVVVAQGDMPHFVQRVLRDGRVLVADRTLDGVPTIHIGTVELAGIN